MRMDNTFSEWKRFLLMEFFVVVLVTATSIWRVKLYGLSGREFATFGAKLVILSVMALLLAKKNEKSDALTYWLVTVGFLLMALGMGAFTLLSLLKHHDFETQLVGWMLLAVIPVPWIFAVAGYFTLENKVRRSNLSLDSQEDILSIARRFSNIILAFVCAIVCGFTRILSFYLK